MEMRAQRFREVGDLPPPPIEKVQQKGFKLRPESRKLRLLQLPQTVPMEWHGLKWHFSIGPLNNSAYF